MKKILILVVLCTLLVAALIVPVVGEAAVVAKFQIYPTPQSVVYGKSVCTIPNKVNLHLGKDLDDVTVAHAYDALAEMDVLAYVDGNHNYDVFVGVAGSGDAADEYALANLTYPADLFDKIDSYLLAIDGKAMVVLGKDADSAYYGLTTLKCILGQVDGNEMRTVTVCDWSDSVYRGFIEGYYGIPWTTDQRIELMEFGSQFKSNIYIYAPKDDPYHSTNWRGLYSDADLEELKEQIDAGKRTKTRFCWSIHPFLSQKFNDNNYQADLQVLLNKFEQLYDAGVRQFMISADDIGIELQQGQTYVQYDASIQRDLLNDVSAWLSQKGDCYNLIFIPSAYCYNSETMLRVDLEYYYQTLMQDLDPTVEIMWTGYSVCSTVANGRFDDFTRLTQGNTTPQGRKGFMWLNWPVNDYSPTHVLMGKGEVFNVEPDSQGNVPFSGIVTNPMQYAEMDKVALFATLDYCWNVGAFDVDKSYDDSFAYIEPTCPDELKQISQHMTNANMYEGAYFEESAHLVDNIEAFLADYESGNDTTQSALALKAQFDAIVVAVDNYFANATNGKLAEEIKPFALSLKYNALAASKYLDINVNFDQMTTDQLQTAGADAADTYLKTQTCTTPVLNVVNYNNEQRVVEIGVAVLNPFVKKLVGYVTDDVNLALGVNTGIVYRGMNGIYQGSLDNVMDGDENTFVWFDGYPTEDAYVRIDLGEVTTIYDVKVVTGKGSGGGDTWKAVVETSADGKTFVAVGNVNGKGTVDLRLSPVDARFVRLRNNNGTGGWLALAEVALNTLDVNAPIFTFENISLESSVATSDANAVDADLATYTWFAPNKTEGAYLQLQYVNAQTVSTVQLLMAKPNSISDYFREVTLAYSVDGATFTTIGTYSGRNVFVELPTPVTAKYIRATATSTCDNGIVVRDFSINNHYAVSVGDGFKLYNTYWRTGYEITHESYATDGKLNTFLDLELGSGTNRTITLDLWQSKDITTISILSGGVDGAWGDLIESCIVEYSANGTDWQLVGNYQQDNGEYSITTNVTARYVRVTVVNGGWITIREISAN